MSPGLPTHPVGTPTPGVDDEARTPRLLGFGVDFRTAPLELREQVAMSPAETEELQVRLVARSEIAEAFVLSTCNRTEVYLRPAHDEPVFRLGLDLALGHRAPDIVDQGRYFVLHDREAARRLLSVAAGLESMVLGEPEILGQVKQAAELALGLGSAGPVLGRLLRTALDAGRRARAETDIGAGAISLGYATVELGRQIFDRLEDRRVLLVGTGETGTLVATALVERGVEQLWFANRSDERARRFSAQFESAERVSITELAHHLKLADVLVSATSADRPLFQRPALAGIVRLRRQRPLLIVDLGVPRNIDPSAAELENLFVHDLDSLRGLIERNLDRRRAEVPAVEAIVGQELTRFLDWYRSLEAEPLVAELQRQAEALRKREVETRLERFPPHVHEDLHRLTRALVRRILHHPSRQLRRGIGDADPADLELIRRLFQLDDDR